MTVQLSQPDFQRLTRIVQNLPDFANVRDRRRLVAGALEGVPQADVIVGVDVEHSIDMLLQQIREELKQPEQPPIQNNSVQTLTGHSDAVNSVAISPDGQILATGSRDQTIKLWNLANGKLRDTLTGHSSVIMSLAFSPDGQTLASASNLEFQDGNIKLWDVGTARLRQTLGGSLLALRTSSVAFSPDGQTLASGHFDAAIKLWNLGTGEVRATLRGHGWDVNSVAFSRDGRLLVSGGVDGAIMIWNWRTGERIRTLNRPSDFFGSLVSWLDHSVGSIWSVTISPDGRTIASGGSDQPIQLWNLGTGKRSRILTEHSGTVRSVAFSSDGKILASGSDDNTLRIWNFHTGELLQTLEHLGPVNSLAFSSDGQTLVSGSDDTTSKVWRVSL